MFARNLAFGASMAAVAQAAAMYGNGTVTTTTEVVTAFTTYCPEATTLTYGDKTYTVTEATTLTITDCPCTLTKPVQPTTTHIAPKDECAAMCEDKYNSCRTAPDANMSYCAAKYAECLGYSPWDSGSFVTPTACSAKPTHTTYTTEVVTAVTTYCPEATTLTYGNKTYTVTKPSTVTITDCHFTTTKPVVEPSNPAPKPTTPGQPGTPGTPGQPGQPGTPAGDCPAECADKYNSCRTAPDANMSTCAAEYAGCLGYNPFGDDGSLITPTACSSAVSPPAATSTPGGSGPSEVPTAGAGRVLPGALVALGAIALL
ncbi:hypothetical protein LIA77_10355 [Sarocladium implicatum]|nr:hypothetical protein LIA77_10355 [Sarocladium implicatum]